MCLSSERKIELSETAVSPSGVGRSLNTLPRPNKELICVWWSMIYQGRGLTVLSETSFWKTPAALLCNVKHQVIKGSVNQVTDSSRYGWWIKKAHLRFRLKVTLHLLQALGFWKKREVNLIYFHTKRNIWFSKPDFRSSFIQAEADSSGMSGNTSGFLYLFIVGWLLVEKYGTYYHI